MIINKSKSVADACINSSYLDMEDIEGGFNVESDGKHISLMRAGQEIAWFSMHLNEEAVKDFIRLIVTLDRRKLVDGDLVISRQARNG